MHMSSTMISMARFQGDSGIQHAKRSHQQQFSGYPQPSGDAPLDLQRSFPQSSAFDFDFRLGTNGIGDVKAPEQRGEQPLVEFGLSAFPEPDRTTFRSQSSYEPTRLQIPSQAHPSDPSPSSYIPSSTSTLASQTFTDFPPSSDSRSLSPLEHTGWADRSSRSLSMSPQDANHTGHNDLDFDNRLAQIPYSVNMQPAQSSLQLPVEPRSLHNNTRPNVTNGHASPGSSSSEITSDFSRPRIGPNGLAEDQPPTAQGKMRTRVYVACLQCRSRKIRCDGAKPKCQKCTRRSSECQYDTAPKRRGPDKKPGARQRTSKKAKLAKEEAVRRAGAELGNDAWDQVAKEDEREDRDVGAAKKRRRASNGQSSSSLTWAAEGEGETCRGSTGTTSSLEGMAPIAPRDVPGVSMGFGAIPDMRIGARDGGKAETNLLDGFTESRAHLHRPTSHDRLPFSFGFDTVTNLENGHAHGNSRIHDLLPTTQHHRQPPEYANPEPTLGLPYFPHAHITAVEEEEQQSQERQRQKRKWHGDGAVGIGSEPSLDFSRKTWWDSLVAMYAPSMDRATTARQIHTDLQFLFKASNYFVSFFNVPLFFSVFCNAAERDNMQPSLVLACLALATFMRSSEINRGNEGRMRALWLRDAAQSALEASFNAQWIEPTLAQAAWLLALFEMCAHPYHSTERSNSSMVMLDTIIRSLALTSIDADDPSVSVFSPRTVPVVHMLGPGRLAGQKGCSCHALSLGHNSRSALTHTPLWTATAAWDPDWSISEIRKEESRRLCWSTLQLAAGHTAHSAAFSAPPLDFYCIQPANYALLFPGEALSKSPSFRGQHPAKETVWALYSRAMLLWNSCLRMRGDDVSDTDKAVFAVGAWIESTAIEEALDAHTCSCDAAFLFQGREFLFITRMCISYEFRRFIPHPESEVSGLFNRKKAQAWLVHQGAVAKRIMNGLHTVTGHKNNVLAQRPFFIWWFMSQAARSLMLWQCDHSLLMALEVCQAFLPPIDYLSCLWPCPAQRTRYLNLHSRLTQACRSAGISLPPPPNFDILAPGSPPVTVV